VSGLSATWAWSRPSVPKANREKDHHREHRNVLVEPTTVEHTTGGLREMTRLVAASCALPVGEVYQSLQAGVQGVARHLKKTCVSFQTRTIERIVAWAGTAAEASELAPMYTRQWQQLDQVRQLLDQQIVAAEQEMAGFFVKTPYVLLLSVHAYYRGVSQLGKQQKPSQPVDKA
jgi:hypothetical protein